MTHEDNPARTVPEHRTRLRRFWPAAPAVIAAGCLGWWFWPSTPPLMELPQPNTTLVSPDVRELMTTTRQSVVDSPNSADAWGQLGMVLLAYEFDRDSVACFQNASALDPEEFRWHYCLGLALTAINRDAATEAFEKALSVSPKDPWTLARLGELKLAEGKIPEAKAFLTKAVAASSRPSARTRQALARTLLASSEFDSALAEATKAVEAAPDSRMALEVLAQAQHRLSNPDASKTLARMQTLPDRPLPWEDPHAGYVLAQRLMASNAEDRMLQAIHSGDIRGAIESGERALQSQPENQAVALRLSELYAETGLQDRAVAILQEEIRRHPSQAELHFRLGVVATLQDNWAQADRHFLEAAKLAPDYVLAWHNHGQCLMKLEKFSEAVTAFEEAVRLAPEQKTSRIHLTRLLLKENRTTEAEKHLRILEVQAPDDAEVVELRGTFSKTTKTESMP